MCFNSIFGYYYVFGVFYTASEIGDAPCRLGTLVKTSFNVKIATFTLKWNYKQSGVRVNGGRNLRELSETVLQNIVDTKRPPLTPQTKRPPSPSQNRDTQYQ